MTESRTTPPASGNPHAEHPDEVTPLLAPAPITPATDRHTHNKLANGSHGHENGPKDDDGDDGDYPPLPLGQCFLLCYARFVEPIAFFCIFPFVNEMVQRNGKLAETDVGFYSGLIESLFSLTQMFVMVFWGRASDRLGRKPVLVVSLFGVAGATAMFGFASTIGQMIFFRCLAGVFAGTVVTIRTMLSEISNPKTQARAFSFFAFAPNVGIFLGPLLGGALANPAEQYGGIFKRIDFFTRFPYALPTIVTGTVGLSAAITSLLFIKETKPPSEPPTSANGSHNGEPERRKPTTTAELLRSPGVMMVLYLYSHAMTLGFAFTAIIPLFYFTDSSHGGIGLSPVQISLLMSVVGMSQAMWLLLVFPPLHKRIGTYGIMNACGTGWPFLFLSVALLSPLVRQSGLSPLFWTLAAVANAIGTGAAMAFTCVQLALNDVSPSPETLGTLNALALTLVSGLRAFGPWFFTSVFAVSAKHPNILGGESIWVLMILLAAGFGVAARFLPENARGKILKKRLRRGEEGQNGHGR